MIQLDVSEMSMAGVVAAMVFAFAAVALSLAVAGAFHYAIVTPPQTGAEMIMRFAAPWAVGMATMRIFVYLGLIPGGSR